MYRVDHATGATVDPGVTPPTATPNRFFQGGDPVAGTGATVVEAEWLNMVQEELCNVVVQGGGIALDKSDRTQLTTAIRNIIGAAGGAFVLKAGDTMTGQLNIQGAGLGVIYSAPSVLNFGAWQSQPIGFGWDGLNNIRVRINDVDLGLLYLNNNPASFVQKAGDTMTGQLQTPVLYPCFPAAASCVIQADAANINWTMDPGFYWQYTRGGAAGGSMTWITAPGGVYNGSIALGQNGVLQTTGDIVGGGAVRLSGWSIGEVVLGQGFLQFSHSTTGVAEFGINLAGVGTPSGLSEFAFSNLVGLTLYNPVQGIAYQAGGTLNRHAFSYSGAGAPVSGGVLGIFVNGVYVGSIQIVAAMDDPSTAQHSTFDALAAINAIALGRFDKELPVSHIDGEPIPTPNQTITKTIELGFLSADDVEIAGPACLVRAIQQLSSRVQALEGSATAA